MKVLLYFENHKALKKSGIGRSLKHQQQALNSSKIPFTLDEYDDFDLAHINTVFFKSHKVLKRIKKMKNIPIIVHGHSTKEDFKNSFRGYKFLSLFFYKQLKNMYSKADLIITPTAYSKSLIQKIAPNVEIVNISNGISLEDYKYNQSEVDAFKEYFSISSEKVIINAGFPFVRKGILDFFEIAKMYPSHKFIWFGALHKFATSKVVLKAIKNKPENVIMPGYVPDEIIKGAFKSADCLMFTSYEENEGIVVLEGLASKIPTLVRDIGVYKDWLTDGVNVFKAKDKERFVEKLNYILNNDTSKIVDNAYEVALERSIEKVGKQMKDIYIKVLNEKKCKK